MDEAVAIATLVGVFFTAVGAAFTALSFISTLLCTAFSIIVTVTIEGLRRCHSTERRHLRDCPPEALAAIYDERDRHGAAVERLIRQRSRDLPRGLSDGEVASITYQTFAWRLTELAADQDLMRDANPRDAENALIGRAEQLINRVCARQIATMSSDEWTEYRRRHRQS